MTTTATTARVGEGIEGFLKPTADARHAPGYVYAAPEMYALEKEHLFMQDWLMMAREEELAEPGDFMTFRVLGEPIVIARNGDGKLHAFANVCAHRGVEVAAGAGNTREFSCPYHGWLYDLEGKLVGAPYMKEAEGFDPTTCRLRPLAIGTWRGCVFVSFNDAAPPLDSFIDRFERDFGYLHPEKCRLSTRITWDFDCNWKLVAENAMDMYHVGVLHASSFGAGTSVDDARVSLHPRGGMRIDYASQPMNPDAKPLFGQLPWIADRPASFASMGFMQPNLHLVARSDQVRFLTGWPTGPESCHVIMYCLFPAEWFDDPDYEEKAGIYHGFLKGVLEEDRDMVASLQHAMTVRAYKPGQMAWLEQPLHHVSKGIVERLFNGGAGAG